MADFTVIKDKSDRKFAALAQACGVLLISHDGDLFSLRRNLEITVLQAREYMAVAGVFRQ